MGTAVAWFANQGARTILAVIDDSGGTNEKCEGLLRFARNELDNLGALHVLTNVQLVSVVIWLDLEATYRLLKESRFFWVSIPKWL